MSITNPTENEVRLRSYGLARVQALRELRDGEFAPGKEVELFITGSHHYLKPEEARAVGVLLIAEAEKCAKGDD